MWRRFFIASLWMIEAWPTVVAGRRPLQSGGPLGDDLNPAGRDIGILQPHLQIEGPVAADDDVAGDVLQLLEVDIPDP